MSVHLPKRNFDKQNQAKTKAQNEIKKSPVSDEMKSGDSAVVYKDKNYRVKKELAFKNPKNDKGIA
jgi:hypothetical protein